MRDEEDGFFGDALRCRDSSSLGMGPRTLSLKASEPCYSLRSGGSADIEARVFARLLEAKIGQPVVPVNRPGGGAVGYAFLRTSPADGYTVAWASPALLTNYRMGTMPFSHRELTPIAMVSVQAMAWVIRTDAPWRTLEDLARFAQSNPGRVRVATAG